MSSPCLARVPFSALSIGVLLLAAAGSAQAAGRGAVPDAARATLPLNDGWGSVPTANLPAGTTGGSTAGAARTHIVTSRKELLAALAYPDAAPKLVLIKGTIDLNVDDANSPLSCADYARPDPASGERYALHAFLGGETQKNPRGAQEEARKASAAAQAARIRVRVPPNTTIYGLGTDATLLGAAVEIAGPARKGSAEMNVVVRNLTFLDTHDCFPEWSPDDGPTGNWNSAYDSIAIHNATHVWIDHNRFADDKTRDALQPVYFGHHYQVHDGLVDITNEADFVTVSWNQFAQHDKTLLIGNSDSALTDRGHLRVTLHHNHFDGTGQRTPRVRFGQVHVYNNVWRAERDGAFRSAWGAGLESQIYAENNYFHMDAPFKPADAIDGKKGTRMTVKGNCWREQQTCVPMDLLAIWNANNDPDMSPDAGWVPTRYGAAPGAESAEAAYQRVIESAGPGKLAGGR